MAMLGAKSYYDRARLLERAGQARKRGRHRKALELYDRVLAYEPKNPELRRRVAPLLVASGRVGEALASYRIAARSLAERGFVEQAVGLYREAARGLPRRREVWEALADLQIQRGRPVDAHGALLEGAGHLRGPEAVALLLRAHRLRPRHLETGFALARGLAKTGERRRAAWVLARMASWTRGRDRRRVRTRQLLLTPGPVTACRWLIALFGG